jgi:opacity protein-like surface antigen
MKTTLLLALLANLALTTTSALAQTAAGSGFSYNYIDARYVSFDDNGFDGDGLRVRGSFQLQDNLLLVGSVALVELDDVDADATVLSIGGGYTFALYDQIDFLGTAEIVRADVDGGDDDTGYALSGGVRAQLIDNLDTRAALNIIDVSDSDSFISLDADYWLSDVLSAGIGFDLGSDTDEIRIGARFSF